MIDGVWGLGVLGWVESESEWEWSGGGSREVVCDR